MPAAQVKQEEAQSLRKVDAFNLQEEYWVRALDFCRHRNTPHAQD